MRIFKISFRSDVEAALAAFQGIFPSTRGVSAEELRTLSGEELLQLLDQRCEERDVGSVEVFWGSPGSGAESWKALVSWTSRRRFELISRRGSEEARVVFPNGSQDAALAFLETAALAEVPVQIDGDVEALALYDGLRERLADGTLSRLDPTAGEVAAALRRWRAAGIQDVADLLAELLWPVPRSENLARFVAGLPSLLAGVGPDRVYRVLCQVRLAHLRADRLVARLVPGVAQHLKDVHRA